MKFGENLKIARENAGMTQKDLATATGIHYRTIQNYESGTRRPKNYEVIEKIALALNIPANALVNSGDELVLQAQQKDGAKAAKDVDELVSEISALFAGGTIDEEAKEGVMAAINRAYWDAKEANKKYTPKKYRKG